MDWMKILKEVRSWVIIIVAAVFIAALLNSQVFAMATVEQQSMETTLTEGQKLIINRLSYRNRIPKRGDIIVFYSEDEIGSFLDEFGRSLKNIFSFFNRDASDERLVKRVIGIEGDVVDIRDGSVYVNGEIIKEPYAKGLTESGSLKLPVTIEENQLFVLGDNRLVSLDSRAFGPIDLKQVEGKAIFCIFPPNRLGRVE